MDTLKGIPEHIEADFGDSIVARDEAVAVLATNAGLGPPDLCWLQKGPKSSGLLRLGSSAEAQGYYHYVLGRDVSSSAAVAAYFALLNSKVEPLSFLLGMWLTSEYTIQRGFYCCYDPLSRMDLRCELCVPGGVVVGCVDAAGVLHDVTPQIWLQVQVCSFVRAMLYDPEMRLNGGSVIAYDPVPTAAAERSLLSAVLRLYCNGSLPGALQDIYAQQGCGVLPEHMDVVLTALWQHFRRRQRWAAAADFFRRLAEVYSPATLLLAAAQRAQGLGSIATGNMLAELLLTTGHREAEQLAPATLVGLAAECLEAGRSQEALIMARQALQASPHNRPAWLLLAQCFIAQKQYAAALVALNVVPTPPLPAAEVELLHVVPPPGPLRTTAPQYRLYDGEVEGVRAQALEESSLDGSRLLAYLPGSILVNREPLGSGFTPDTSPNRITRSVLSAVYTLLQDIVSQTSWDAFLEVRSRVFLMQHEAAAVSPHATRELPVHQHQSNHHQRQQQQHDGMQALQNKLGQIVIQNSVGPDSKQENTERSAANGTLLHEQQHQQQQAVSTTAAGSATSPGGASSPGNATAGTTTASPPSRGHLSSSSGQRGSPKSYYASKLQAEKLTRLSRSSGGHSSSSTSARGSTSSPQQQTMLEQQLHQHMQAPAADTTAAADAAAVGALRSAGGTATAVMPQPQTSTPGEGDRSMTGRVLLLGRTHARKVAAGNSTTTPGLSSSMFQAQTADCGVPRSFSPNEIEDLTKLDTASKVAPIRTTSSITPQLWEVVFGAARSPPAAGSRLGLHYQQQQQAAEAFTSAAALPRIRTKPADGGMRPLGECVEQEEGSAGQVGQDGSTAQHSGNDCMYNRQLNFNSSVCMNSNGLISTGTAESSCQTGSIPSAAASVSRQNITSSGHPQQQQRQSFSKLLSGCFSSSQHDRLCRTTTAAAVGAAPAAAPSAVGPGPIAEGLDRTGSLLLRSSSVASSVSASHSSRYAVHGAGPNGSSHLGDGAGSGNFGSSLARRASLTGQAVSRTLEADREGLVNGWIADDAGTDMAGPDGVPTRRLCVRWLDELIVALWHDLQSYMEWKVWDQKLKEARGGTHAELVLGLVSGAETPRTPASDGGSLAPPSLTHTDWQRRGALAERLGHVSDARAAYRASVKAGFNITSYMALLRLEAEANNVSDTLLCAQQIISWHLQRLRAGSSSGSGSGATGGSSSNSVVMGVPPEAVHYCIGQLCDGVGTDAVLQAAQTGAEATAADSFKAVLQDWSQWQQVQVQAGNV